jgi:hypothetical protein
VVLVVEFAMLGTQVVVGEALDDALDDALDVDELVEFRKRTEEDNEELLAELLDTLVGPLSVKLKVVVAFVELEDDVEGGRIAGDVGAMPLNTAVPVTEPEPGASVGDAPAPFVEFVKDRDEPGTKELAPLIGGRGRLMVSVLSLLAMISIEVPPVERGMIDPVLGGADMELAVLFVNRADDELLVVITVPELGPVKVLVAMPVSLAIVTVAMMSSNSRAVTT